MHAGAEGTSAQHVTGQDETYLGEDRGNPQSFAHKAIDAGASLVIASSPRAARHRSSIEAISSPYSLGNFAGYGNYAGGSVLDLSAILNVTLTAIGEFPVRAAHRRPLTGKGQPKPGRRSCADRSALHQDFGPAAAQLAPGGHLASLKRRNRLGTVSLSGARWNISPP